MFDVRLFLIKDNGAILAAQFEDSLACLCLLLLGEHAIFEGDGGADNVSTDVFVYRRSHWSWFLLRGAITFLWLLTLNGELVLDERRLSLLNVKTVVGHLFLNPLLQRRFFNGLLIHHFLYLTELPFEGASLRS